ncbi:efflux RND transporter permease subunit [Burkholderia pseudomultivorans]|uniref:Acriflavin resistance protein n=1 Tax=Burkholderia pseudomultivorans TaxID=1207504 RepID=A0A6P2R2K7_9BURK|nr:efflux RND transporter permease subunit [Burkholderia pseudomultivorans]MDR8728037.1 Multidrug resistance protein MdtC [Burkholderia pseudomultivorans]MDR8734148.1 Multidrug resistance protein MdtC [Burkholderia pseudomultivorans]MDR8743538.1 Multidrug resistance protein MdtC [Burkholderia pseudomultivorans]MDR8755408.1 Multidrug resistance protein MdtC [Burkholderia pseudomultivorans]MDR8779662.1 Multidrug resistance protein MdtC [Burkholderia pseudomultivorans]
MWIVRLALRRPYTFVVLALLIFIAGALAILRTPTDIFPNIDIPVVSIVWSYNGFSAEDMAKRITTNYERALTSDVDDIEHIESQSLNGVSVVKIFFHPGADINRAIAEAASNSASILRILPPGTLPPNIITYNASTVPILQLGLSSKTLPEQSLYDLGNSFIRTQLATVQGAAVPLPFGGKVPEIVVNLNTRALQAKGLAPIDVVNAINAQNLILPGGTAKIGTREYDVQMNGSTQTVAALNNLPVKTVGGNVVYVRDVAHVVDGFAPQTNIVRSDGKRAALLTVEKSGSASTLTIIGQVKAMLPKIAAGLPKALQITPLGDQSVFVKSAIQGVAREALIAACLTALMILLFLGSWRATLIIAVTIPLAVLTSLCALSALGETINIMTLGGLALAVGILVDDATVAIENITHHLERGAPLEEAILTGAGEIAVPTFVSTLSICIVFAPMFLLTGVARYLFVPMAEAVIFAMLASYFFSRTLIPTLAMVLMRAGGHGRPLRGMFARFARFQAGFEHGFESVRARYRALLSAAIAHRRRFAAAFLLACAASTGLFAVAGQDFFPSVDTGEIRLHLRAPTGTRIEQTARLTDQVEARVRAVIPAHEMAGILDNIGVPVSGINLTYDSSDPIGAGDADVMITLKPNHRPTATYVARLRNVLNRDFPGVSFAFLPADIVSQILNFGLPAPIDIQIVGNKLDQNRAVANRLLAQLRGVRGLVDARIQQPGDAPAINVDVDRTKAIQAGLQQRDVSQNLLIALSGSSQTSPNFWLNPSNGVSYPVLVQTPQYEVDSLQSLANIPMPAAAQSPQTPAGGPAAGSPAQNLLGTLGTFSRAQEQAVVSHYNVQPVLDIFASVQDRDLGGVTADVTKLVDAARAQLPPGSSIVLRGQVQAMHQSFAGLLSGLVLAIALVYLLMVVNFQSWTDPLVIVSGLPASLAGIAWMLFVTNTTLSVPALTGTILCIGIATANSILVVNTARELIAGGAPPWQAALDAGFSRFRPVLMTALAMLIGMLPMALGLGDGGEQNAPLGRAVIGGLAFGTLSTLLFVPVVFGFAHAWLDRRRDAAAARRAQDTPVLP